MTEIEKLQIHERNLRVLELCHRDELRKAEGPEHAEMEMAFIDALSWARSRCGEEMTKARRCPACAGSGRYEEGPIEEHDVCGVCNGTGRASHLADAERVSGEQSGRIVELERAIIEITSIACPEIGEVYDSDPEPRRAARAVMRLAHRLAEARADRAVACSEYFVVAQELGCVHHHPHGAPDSPGTYHELLAAICALRGDGPATRPMRPVGVVTKTGVLTDAVDLPAFPDEDGEAWLRRHVEAAVAPVEAPVVVEPAPEEWGVYAADEAVEETFATREQALAYIVREEGRELLLGRRVLICAEDWIPDAANDFLDRLTEHALENISIEEIDFGLREGAAEAFDETIKAWVRQYIDDTGCSYFDGETPTADELDAARSALAARPPCPCSAGAACTYRDEPPGDPDTGHCQDCGAYMPHSPETRPDTEVTCSTCGAFYMVGEPEDA